MHTTEFDPSFIMLKYFQKMEKVFLIVIPVQDRFGLLVTIFLALKVLVLFSLFRETWVFSWKLHVAKSVVESFHE